MFTAEEKKAIKSALANIPLELRESSDSIEYAPGFWVTRKFIEEGKIFENYLAVAVEEHRQRRLAAEWIEQSCCPVEASLLRQSDWRLT